MFMNLAHRGASEYAPENTLAAFYKGIEMGANGIETDMKRTKDGVLVLFHDDTLDRTTNGSGKPADYTWEELSRLDAGSWFSPRYAGERLITLDQFLYHFGRKSLFFALELKDRDIEKPALEAVDKYGIRDRVTLSSFHYDSLQRVRELDRMVKIGHLVRKIDEDSIHKLLAIGGQQICPRADMLTREDVAAAKEHGLEVRAWGALDETLMHRVLECGADGTTINFPDKLTAALEEARGSAAN